jgi:hemin uptake protein HemP
MNRNELPVSEADQQKSAPLAMPPRVSSSELFCQGKSLEIEHEGKVYQLRITRLGKLILTA